LSIDAAPLFLSAEKCRRRLQFAALDLRHDLRQFGMTRRRHADLGAFARNQAVHLLDLGAPALDDVLRHRRPLDVGAGIRVGLWDEDGLDLVDRRLVAFICAYEHVGLDAANFLELEAEGTADPDAFGGELDRETADRRVARAVGVVRPVEAVTPLPMPFWQSLVQRSPHKLVVTFALSMPLNHW
jgi:hypothetical protein